MLWIKKWEKERDNQTQLSHRFHFSHPIAKWHLCHLNWRAHTDNCICATERQYRRIKDSLDNEREWKVEGELYIYLPGSNIRIIVVIFFYFFINPPPTYPPNYPFISVTQSLCSTSTYSNSNSKSKKKSTYNIVKVSLNFKLSSAVFFILILCIILQCH